MWGSGMNMRCLKKSRKPPRGGDYFVLQVRDGEYIFGRVISSSARAGILDGCILIYIYRRFGTRRELRPCLARDGLLVPPMLTNRLPWSRGYFENVGNEPLTNADVLLQHCFRDSRGRFFDEMGRALSGETKPCGEFGLHSYRTIDDAISSAMGIPISPD